MNYKAKYSKIKRKLKCLSVKPTLETEKEAFNILAKNGIKANGWNNEEVEYRDMIDIVAYLLKYNNIESKRKDISIQGISAAFNAVPWMAQKSDNYYVKALELLCDHKIIKKVKLVKIVRNVKSIKLVKKVNNIKNVKVVKSVKVIKNSDYEDKYYLVLKGYPKKYKKVELVLSNKKEYDEICRCIETYRGKNIVLKMSVFHARSFTNINSENMLLKLIKQNPNLKLEILCVGKCSGNIIREGANKKQLKISTQPGMLKLYDLAYWHRKQVKVRIVRDYGVDTAYRGSIIIVEDNIEHCFFSLWRYGQERANCGTLYDVPKESTLALQINQFFDEAFERGIPARRNFEWIIYWIKRGVKFFVILLVLAVLQWFVLKGTKAEINSNGNDILKVFFSLFIIEILEQGIKYLHSILK